MAMFWIILTIYIFYIFLEFFLTMFDKSVKVWMRESVWKCKRTVKLTLAQNMPTFAPKARRSAFIRTRTAHARPSSLKKIFTFSSVLFNLFLWLNLILTSGAVLHLHLGWYSLKLYASDCAKNIPECQRRIKSGFGFLKWRICVSAGRQGLGFLPKLRRYFFSWDGIREQETPLHSPVSATGKGDWVDAGKEWE